MTTQDEAFAPITSSQDTLATYKNPFGFSLQVIESGQNLTIGFNGASIAQVCHPLITSVCIAESLRKLNLPSAPADGGVSTGNVVDLVLSFQDQPLRSLDNDGFTAFFAAVTDTSSVGMELSGTADVVGRTSIGDVPISGIPFDVHSTLTGINSFNGTASLSNVSITGSGGTGGNEFIVSPLTTTLNNPSNISLTTVDISLPVTFQGVLVSFNSAMHLRAAC